MKVKMIVEYDGSEFCGWQVQPGLVSVQGILEDAVYSLTGERVKIIGSGRTDAGVHAEGQVAHFEIKKMAIPPEKLFLAMNTILPASVKVKESCSAPQGFNARRSAKKKTYRYSMYKSRVFLPLKEKYAYRVNENLDVEKMRECANLFVGEHDFKGFCATKSGAKTTVRTIYNIDIVEDGIDVLVSVTGNGFLYNMVRIMVGTLLEVGFSQKSISDVKASLEKGQRSKLGRTLPAKALCLMTVGYDE